MELFISILYPESVISNRVMSNITKLIIYCQLVKLNKWAILRIDKVLLHCTCWYSNASNWISDISCLLFG